MTWGHIGESMRLIPSHYGVPGAGRYLGEELKALWSVGPRRPGGCLGT